MKSKNWRNGIMEGKQGALENLTVLDLTRVVAGPFATSILGDMGARVIKVELPDTGDDARTYGPFKNGESIYYANLNRSKQGITLNLKQEKGKALLLELVKKADILIENYRPGVMDKLGLGYEVLKEVNDQLIYASVSGFGTYGPYAQRPGYDILAQAMGGLMSLTGEKNSNPTRAGNAMGDILGGLNVIIGILAAVNARQIIGHGQRIDVALVDCVAASLENAFIRYLDNGELYERNGNAYAAIAPYDSYRAKDGQVIIACGNQKLYEIFCTNVLHKPEWIMDERFLTNELRVKNMEIQKRMIEEWSQNYTVNEITDLLLAQGVPAGPIYNVEQILADRHITEAREMFVKVDHPVIGEMTVNGNAVKMFDTMPRVVCPAPTLGQHNETVYCGLLGLDQDEVKQLQQEGVI